MKLSQSTHRRPLMGLALIVLLLPACGLNSVVDSDEDVKAAWAEVESQYKRRADLVPNLVQTVRGAANFEQSTLVQVTQARARATGITVDGASVADPAKLRAFEAAQQQLSGALSRLLVASERYPELRATASFQDLQAQLEGTENRITVARRRFIDSVASYNKVVLRFPTLIGARLRGMAVRPSFSGIPGQENPPEIKF